MDQRRTDWSADDINGGTVLASAVAASRAHSCCASGAVSGDWRPLCVVTPRGRRPAAVDRFD
jgi:hypothetical protein